MVGYMHHSITLFKKVFQKYSMHLFGIVAFLLMVIAGVFILIKNYHDLAVWIPYGILVFMLNIFYIKIIRISRQDYENELKKEKDYSQNLLKIQKRFLRNAIHETNTPLAIIMANIELYEHEYGKNPALSNIEAATKNIYGIYDDLSYLAKKDKVVYPKHSINLSEFIQQRITFFEIVALQSNLTIVFKNLCDDVSIMINETKLQRIVDNNITNAIKYSKEFEVIALQLYDYHDGIIFEISSTSTIIKEPEHVFDAYYRENYDKDGLGLGLNLVKRICTEEDILIELNSNEEKTSFKYYFKKESFEDFTT